MKQALGTLLALILTPALAQAWVIDDFTSAITIEPAGTVLVEESIAVDFGIEDRHGIYRDLPIMYTGEDGEIYTSISDVAVSSESASGAMDLTRESGWLRIRIGDPDVTVTGKHIYRISYRVAGVIRAFEGYDELYWNVTGNGWDVPIARASASVRAPTAFVQSACYRGPTGSATPCESEEGSVYPFTATDLAPYEGLTVAIGIPSGTVPLITVSAPPTPADALFSPLALGSFILVSLGGLFAITRYWWLYGRDRFLQRSVLPGITSQTRDGAKEGIVPLFAKHTVSVEYDAPDGLRPAEIGVLLDEKADTRDISATIVDLASRGFLEITEVPKLWLFGSVDYSFTRTTAPAETLMPFEKLLLERLFAEGNEVTMSSLKNSFYTDLKEVKDALYADMVKKKLFDRNPATVRSASVGIGVGVAALGVAGVSASIVLIASLAEITALLSLLMGVSLGFIVTGVIAALWGPFMPRKSGLGRELYQRALGYREFVSGTEKYRSRFAEDTGLFTLILPYAIMFGVTHKLAAAFKDMGIEPKQPSWYHGTQPWNAALFASEMGSFSKSLGSAISSAPSGSGSGGGGSSGGGFGGGGGGAW